MKVQVHIKEFLKTFERENKNIKLWYSKVVFKIYSLYDMF